MIKILVRSTVTILWLLVVILLLPLILLGKIIPERTYYQEERR